MCRIDFIADIQLISEFVPPQGFPQVIPDSRERVILGKSLNHHRIPRCLTPWNAIEKLRCFSNTPPMMD